MKRILVVEDSEDLVGIWERLFTIAGYEFAICMDGHAALKTVSEKKFDMIISDYYLPDITGLELLEKIRGQKINTPFILVTGSRESFIADAIRGFLNASVLYKPIPFKQLLAKISEFFDGKGQEVLMWD